MKTCGFRGAHRRSREEGIFCLEPPDVRYYLSPCTNTSCVCCYQPLMNTHRNRSSIRFVCEQPHRFVNGYEIYLNAHATCSSNNFIYVLTCPCGQYDFVGCSHDTKEQTVKDILLYHRRQSIRILHEFIIGHRIIQRTLEQTEQQRTQDEKRADQLFLYRHLTQCSAALQILLNCSSQYGCLIPMNHREADQQDTEFIQPHANEMYQWSARERTDDEVDWCLAHVREPIDGTRYSKLQLYQQRLFFKRGYDLLILPHRHLDIFDLSIVFLLPEDCSSSLARMIESLLIIHGQCKLNQSFSSSSSSSACFEN